MTVTMGARCRIGGSQFVELPDQRCVFEPSPAPLRDPFYPGTPACQRHFDYHLHRDFEDPPLRYRSGKRLLPSAPIKQVIRWLVPNQLI
jgi:hypothetical protein